MLFMFFMVNFCVAVNGYVFFTWILDVPCWILDIQKRSLFIQRFCSTLYLLSFILLEELTKLFFGFSSRRWVPLVFSLDIDYW